MIFWLFLTAITVIDTSNSLMRNGENRDSTGDCIKENTAYYGHNLVKGYDNIQNSMADCAKSCRNHAICHFWTWDKIGGACFLKEYCGDCKTGNDRGYISAFWKCEVPEIKDTTGSCFKENTAYYGNNIVLGWNNKQKSKADCAKSCRNNARCKFWSWNMYSGACFLKSSCGSCQTGNNKSFISGSKNCQMSGSDTPKNCNCGLANRSKRIVGGEETEISEYPWQVGLVSSKGDMSEKVWCGGSVISDEWILTAAHCVDSSQPQDIQVLLGEHDYNDDSETEVVRANLKKIVMHPNYDDQTDNYDFALLQLTNPIDFSENKHIRPICLPSNATCTAYTDAEAIVSGWGVNSWGGTLQSKLQDVTVKVISNDDCKKAYGTSRITEQMICAKANGKDSCQGDSGGPLVSANGGDGVTPGQNYESIGVVSWGYKCANPWYPGVYARTTAQLDWIIQETKGSFNTCPHVTED